MKPFVDHRRTEGMIASQIKSTAGWPPENFNSRHATNVKFMNITSTELNKMLSVSSNR